MSSQDYPDLIIERIHSLEREIEELKRDVLFNLSGQSKKKRTKASHFGSIQAVDMDEDAIEESKKSLFRPLSDL